MPTIASTDFPFCTAPELLFSENRSPSNLQFLVKIKSNCTKMTPLHWRLKILNENFIKSSLKASKAD